MIVDSHTHIFPLRMRQRREEYLRRDPSFAEMYASPKARLASAEELLASMDEAEIDKSVVLGFAWSELEPCVQHNDYLLEAAARSGGRLIPFCTIQPRAGNDAFREMERCARAGARGLGELRPDSQGYRLDEGAAAEVLAEAALRHGLVLLFHVSEPVGHAYPGKEALSVASFHRFVVEHGGQAVVGAHWGGGLPFYALMPEVRQTLTDAYFDTAATPLLYEPAVYREAADLVGAEHVLFGSDFPLIEQRRQRQAIEEAFTADDPARSLILGENARRLLRLEP
jgi:predicted TIM-barrel fold metal-dependent hydrolase